jgi:hypothetical protein
MNRPAVHWPSASRPTQLKAAAHHGRADGTPGEGRPQHQRSDDYHALNLAFHDRIVDFVGNRKLIDLYRRLVKELSLFRRANLADGQQIPVSVQEHRAILKAIAAGDADGAAGTLPCPCAGKQGAHAEEPHPTGAVNHRGMPATAPERPDMLDVNGRTYQLPKAPTVVVCVDGCEPDYIAQAVAAGAMPWMARTLARAPPWWPTAWCPASPTPTT